MGLQTRKKKPTSTSTTHAFEGPLNSSRTVQPISPAQTFRGPSNFFNTAPTFTNTNEEPSTSHAPTSTNLYEECSELYCGEVMVESDEATNTSLPEKKEIRLPGSPVTQEQMTTFLNNNFPPNFSTQRYISFTKLSESAFSPTKAHIFDPGFDLACPYNVRIKPKDCKVIDTHLSIMIPYGCYGQLIVIPSIAEKGIIILGRAVEFGFTGEVKFTIFNLSHKELHFPRGTRIARLIPHIICYPILQETPKFSCQLLQDN